MQRRPLYKSDRIISMLIAVTNLEEEEDQSSCSPMTQIHPTDRWARMRARTVPIRSRYGLGPARAPHGPLTNIYVSPKYRRKPVSKSCANLIFSHWLYTAPVRVQNSSKNSCGPGMSHGSARVSLILARTDYGARNLAGRRICDSQTIQLWRVY